MEKEPGGGERALDARVAALVFDTPYTWLRGDYLRPDPEDAIAYFVCPRYSADIAAAFAVEEQIAARGLQERYISELATLVLGGDAFGFFHRGAYGDQAYAIAHASPYHRCVAALHTLEPATTAG
jgi:hypothetical protein